MSNSGAPPKALYTIATVEGTDARFLAPFVDPLPTADELWALPIDQRIELIWDSGVRPNTPELREVFASCGCLPGKGVLIEMALQTEMPPNGRFYRGEKRLDLHVWPDGPPDPLHRRRVSSPLRRRTRRQQEEAMRSYELENSLWAILLCGCVDECPGPEWHAEIEAAEECRERELRRDIALREARLALTDELVRGSMSDLVDLGSDVSAEFDVVLARCKET
jgi:hypothetical protein